MANVAYTPAQLARHWHVSARTVYKMVEAGELGHIRVRSLIRIRQADVEAYEAKIWRAPIEQPTILPAPLPRNRATPHHDAFAAGQRFACAGSRGEKHG